MKLVYMVHSKNFVTLHTTAEAAAKAKAELKQLGMDSRIFHQIIDVSECKDV